MNPRGTGAVAAIVNLFVVTFKWMMAIGIVIVVGFVALVIGSAIYVRSKIRKDNAMIVQSNGHLTNEGQRHDTKG